MEKYNYSKFVDEFRRNGKLSYVIPMNKLQRIQDEFHKSTGYGITLLDHNNEHKTVPCQFHESLIRSQELIKLSAGEENTLVFMKFQNRLVCGVPVTAKGKHFGYFVVHAGEGEITDEVKVAMKKWCNFLFVNIEVLMERGFFAYERNVQIEAWKKLDEKLEHQNEELQHKNDFDELTGLYSRSYFNEKCEELEKVENPLLSIVMGDVNNLKITNDLFGHRHGDILLMTIARIMMEEAEPHYIVARCGGDEINVLMPNALRREADWYCDRVRKRLEKVIDCSLIPSVSMGVGKRSDMSQSIKDIINIADVKMYRNKVEYKKNLNVIDDIYRLLLSRGVITSEYTNRVLKLGVGFCKFLKCDDVTISQMKLLSWMHELGATMLTDRNYFKDPSERTMLENREIRKHSEIGAKIAVLHSDTEPVADVILQLHENWDGTGYPKRLEGAQIRPLARILQVVTEYCRMVEVSKMGEGLPSEEAKNRIIAESDKKFDPGMVRAFIKYLVSIGK